jgi:hypothetical protein
VVVLVAISVVAGAALAAGTGANSLPLSAAHRIPGWLALVAAALLAMGPGTPPPARAPMRLAAGALALSVAIALAGPGTGLAHWLHNVLSAAAIAAAIAASALARSPPSPR